ncbi:7-cyano-7-deazaguanine synthase [Actinomycetaceae bacterium TAE3-ERU4]|nr:7-cyano-7-deazaguanine synthase [Actinomycetaceae bacterium TAE3-ERU4]
MPDLLLDLSYHEQINEKFYFWDGLGVNQPDEIKDACDLSKLRGHWSAILLSDNEVKLCADAFRSRPLYYALSATEILVTDDWFKAIEYVGYTLDEAAYEQLAMAGFVFGEATCAKGIWQVPSGQTVSINLDTCEVSHSFARTPLFVKEKEQSSAQFITALDKVFNTVMKRAVDSCPPNSKILLPLSGGYDSRLLAAWFAKNYNGPILTFSYGKPGSRELEISKQVAQSLNLPWRGIEMTPHEVHKEWGKPQTAQFLREAFSGFSLPHVQDWYALTILSKQGLCKPGDTVFPGHTIVDNFHNLELLDSEPIKARDVAAAIFHKHCVMRPRIHTDKGELALKVYLHDFLSEVGFEGTARSVQRCIEGFNFCERQTKYINNSMRAYEHFGLRWAVPMLDVEFTETWLSAPLGLTIKRGTYERWIDSFFASLTHASPAVYQGIAHRLPPNLRRGLKKVAATARIDKLATRTVQARTCLNHPLGFELFSGKLSRPELTMLYLFGQPGNGPWVDQFIKDTWHPDLQLFTPLEDAD